MYVMGIERTTGVRYIVCVRDVVRYDAENGGMIERNQSFAATT